MDAVDEVLMLEDCEVGRNGGGDALDAELVKRAKGPSNRDVSISTPTDELADKVVVVLADGVA
ncbi:unannotated protein [freshwater metagenome]|uniref:Unannotated protein n=1 Tax=freshwater metagenome TaxID=449393 RepID=A0A6J5YXK8_9ZZZZ